MTLLYNIGWIIDPYPDTGKYRPVRTRDRFAAQQSVVRFVPGFTLGVVVQLFGYSVVFIQPVTQIDHTAAFAAKGTPA